MARDYVVLRRRSTVATAASTSSNGNTSQFSGSVSFMPPEPVFGRPGKLPPLPVAGGEGTGLAEGTGVADGRGVGEALGAGVGEADGAAPKRSTSN